MKIISLTSPYAKPAQRSVAFRFVRTLLEGLFLRRIDEFFVGELLTREVVLRASSGEGLDGSRWGTTIFGDKIALISDSGPSYDERTGKALRCLRVNLPMFSLVSYRIVRPGKRPERRIDLTIPAELGAYLREVLALDASSAIQHRLLAEASSTLISAWQNSLESSQGPETPSALLN